MRSLEIKPWMWVSAALVLISGLLAAIVLAAQPISDEALKAQFSRQRKEMELLVSILSSNPAVFMIQRNPNSKGTLEAGDELGHPVPMLTSTVSQLQRLFDYLDCDYVSRNASEVSLAPKRNGIEDLHPGGYKTFVFCSTPPGSIVSSIDEFRRRNPGKYDCYQHLDGPWYIKWQEAHY
jgi:hypothetical protein